MTEQVADINSLVLSGEVRKLFAMSQTKGGTSNRSFSLKFRNRLGWERQVIVQSYGELADNLSVDEGDYVIVSGNLDESRWQDKETEEWNGRHDLVANTVVNVADLESGNPLDD